MIIGLANVTSSFELQPARRIVLPGRHLVSSQPWTFLTLWGPPYTRFHTKSTFLTLGLSFHETVLTDKCFDHLPEKRDANIHLRPPKHFARMRLFFSLSILSTLLLPLLALETGKQDISVYVWPMTESKPRVLAEVTYDPHSLSASTKKYHNLSPLPSDYLVRVGLYNPKTTEWSGIVTSGSYFRDSYAKTIVLHLDHEGHPFHVGFGVSASSGEKPSDGKKPGVDKNLKVTVKPPVQGPQPHLNKPVVLNQDGKVEEKEPEKSFFQKYVLAVSFLTNTLILTC